MKHTYYRTCPICGAHNDPGEHCDCCDYVKKEGKTTMTENLNIVPMKRESNEDFTKGNAALVRKIGAIAPSILERAANNHDQLTFSMLEIISNAFAVLSEIGR